MRRQASPAPNRQDNREDGERDVRVLTARWTVTARLEMLSASQIGSQESVYADQTFERAKGGLPMLRGATLAGALRSTLQDRMNGYRSPEGESRSGVHSLFGWLDGEEPHESPLIVFDSVAESAAVSVIRDGVRIAPETGLAQEGFKFDREIALPALIFPLRVDLLVPLGESESALVEALSLGLEGLTDGSIRLGARKTRGWGVCRATGFRALRYDLTRSSGWLRYAESNYGTTPLCHLPRARVSDSPRVALKRAWTNLAPQTKADVRQTLRLVFTLSVDGTLLIRSPGMGKQAAEVTHLTENGKKLLSGSSIANALSRQSRRILTTLAFPAREREIIMNGLFGCMPDRGAGINAPQGSRVYVEEAEVKEARSYRQTRVKIDRFTGGVIDGALVEEEPSVEGNVNFTVIVRQSGARADEALDLPLLLLAGRDLLDGLVTVGGGASVGRGLLKGQMTASVIAGGKESVVCKIASDQGMISPTSVKGGRALLAPLLKRLPKEGGTVL